MPTRNLFSGNSSNHQARIDWLRDAAQEGIDAIERGEFITLTTPDDIDRMVDEIHAEVAAQNL
jgi:hypothetical protein